MDLKGIRIAFREVAAGLPVAGGERSMLAFERGSVTVKLYAPRGEDLQQPHTRDELYVVARGSGVFVCGPTGVSFGANDVLFAPAGLEHRFENFSEDLFVWVIFYGPEGGEVSS